MDKDADRGGDWMVIIVIALVGVAIAAGGYYWFEQMRAERNAPQRPSAEWTAAPDAGAEVELPETPVTNVPPPA